MEQEILAENIKNQIRDRRAKRNMTLGQLGIKIGAAPTVIWQWEQGRHSPSIWYMVRLSEVFGCSVDELIGRNSDGKGRV